MWTCHYTEPSKAYTGQAAPLGKEGHKEEKREEVRVSEEGEEGKRQEKKNGMERERKKKEKGRKKEM